MLELFTTKNHFYFQGLLTGTKNDASGKWWYLVSEYLLFFSMIGYIVSDLK